jgi:hypothetical protein
MSTPSESFEMVAGIIGQLKCAEPFAFEALAVV